MAISFRLPECDEERMLMGWNQHPDWNTFFISNPGTSNKNQKETETTGNAGPRPDGHTGQRVIGVDPTHRNVQSKPKMAGFNRLNESMNRVVVCVQ